MKLINRILISIPLFLLCLDAGAQEIRKVKIEDLETYIAKSDHPLLVSFWATWCIPCVHEIPWLQAAVEKYKDQKPELLLVSLDFAESYPDKIAGFLKQRGFKATYFWLDETNADHFCPKIDVKWSGGIPANLFVNPVSGYRKFIARQLTDRQVDLEIRTMLEVK